MLKLLKYIRDLKFTRSRDLLSTTTAKLGRRQLNLNLNSYSN